MCHSVPRCTSCHRKSSTGGHRKWCPALSLPQPNTSSTTSIKTTNHPFQQYLHEGPFAKSASFPAGQKEGQGQGQGQANPAIVNVVNAAYAAASYQTCEKCWRKGWKGHKKWCPTLPHNDPPTAQSAGFTHSTSRCGTTIARCSECRRKSWKGHRRACPLFNAAAPGGLSGSAGEESAGGVLSGNGVSGIFENSDLARDGTEIANAGRYPTAETATANTSTATALSKAEEATGPTATTTSADANRRVFEERQEEAPPPAYDFKG